MPISSDPNVRPPPGFRFGLMYSTFQSDDVYSRFVDFSVETEDNFFVVRIEGEVSLWSFLEKEWFEFPGGAFYVEPNSLRFAYFYFGQGQGYGYAFHRIGNQMKIHQLVAND